MQRHKDRWQMPAQGDQVVLAPDGNYVPGVGLRGERYDIPRLIALLDRVLAEFPPDPDQKDALDLKWFYWNPKDQGLPGHFNAEFISRLDRKPVLTVTGPEPRWLNGRFLRKHLRQFIWTRGGAGRPGLTVHQVEPERKELLSLPFAGADPESVSAALDRAWLEYMKVRPLTARGYIDNPFGGWLKPVMERAAQEEREVREQARKGALKPPGRE